MVDHTIAINLTVALPCDPQPSFSAGTRRVSAPSRPDSDKRKRTRRRLLSSRLWRPKCSGAGKYFRGGDQPGRRAVLEETNSTSDHMNCTASDPFSQANCHAMVVHIVCVFSCLCGRLRALSRIEDDRLLACKNPFIRLISALS